jgi:hypothetical protein
MFNQNPVLDPKDIRRDPIHRQADPRESSVNDDKISISHDYARFIFQPWREAFDEVKEAMSRLLNKVWKASRTCALFRSCIV